MTIVLRDNSFNQFFFIKGDEAAADGTELMRRFSGASDPETVERLGGSSCCMRELLLQVEAQRSSIAGYMAVIAAEITTNAPDFGHLRPMIETALAELEQAGVTERPSVALAHAQY